MPIRPFSLEEYHWLIEHGLFHEDERVELIEGVLRQMSPKGRRHSSCLTRMLRIFHVEFGEQTSIRSQDPITLLDSNSEPEPDVVVARRRDDDYLEHNPYPEDVLLVVEIAYSSLEYDRRVKAPLYAAAGIAEYWIVNLVESQIEVYREPERPAEGAAYYRLRLIVPSHDSVHPIHFPDCSIVVEDALLAAGRD